MIVRLFSIFFLSVFCVAVISAQVSVEQQVLSTRDEFFKIRTRSMELERVKREAARPTLRDSSTLNFPAIKEDFERIQKLNEEFFGLISAKNPINYAAVLKSVTEINHRSTRLKSNLFTADREKQKETENEHPPEATQPLTNSFANLDKSIISFAHNSIFQNINLVSPQDSLKAQEDLEAIVKFSSIIKEESKKLIRNTLKK